MIGSGFGLGRGRREGESCSFFHSGNLISDLFGEGEGKGSVKKKI